MIQFSLCATEITKLRIHPTFRMFEIIQFLLCGVSLCTITSISLDRFAALHYHMQYVAIVTVRRVAYMLITTWIGVFTLSVFYFLNKIIYFAGTYLAICVCLLISTISYIRIFRIVQQHRLRIFFQRQAIQRSDEARLKKSAVNSFIFYVFIVLCYLPMLISLSLHTISRDDWTTMWNFADTVVFMNSTMNPFLYCWRLRELRTAV